MAPAAEAPPEPLFPRAGNFPRKGDKRCMGPTLLPAPCVFPDSAYSSHADQRKFEKIRLVNPLSKMMRKLPFIFRALAARAGSSSGNNAFHTCGERAPRRLSQFQKHSPDHYRFVMPAPSSRQSCLSIVPANGT